MDYSTSYLTSSYGSATWLASISLIHIKKPVTVVNTFFYSDANEVLGFISVSLSSVVNAVITGLILLRNVKVYWEWEVRPTSKDRDLGILEGAMANFGLSSS